MNNCFDETTDPSDCVGPCALDEASLLGTIDPNDLKEWIEYPFKNVSEEQDSTSVESDDLKEWLEAMSCSDETELLESLLKDDVRGVDEQSKIDYPVAKTISQIQSINNISTPIISTDKSAIDEHVARFQQKLEVAMFKTELSRQQFLKKKRFSLPQNLKPSSLTNNLNDFVVGKRKSLTSELEESRKRLRMCQPDDHVLAHADFFSGKRKSLTSELEQSRNSLMMLGGLNVQNTTTQLSNIRRTSFTSEHNRSQNYLNMLRELKEQTPPTRISECSKPSPNNSKNAKMA
jgi:hypothetical protein